MAQEKNVLLLTNYAGVLQIMPLGNKTFFEAQNRTIRKFQYKFREMSQDEALKFVENNQGRDPDYLTPSKATNLLSQKDQQIEDLKAQLEALQGPIKAASLVKVPEGLSPIKEAINEAGKAQEKAGKKAEAELI